MTHSAPAPFDALSPDVVFEAAESIGLEPSGRLFALNSYENRVYQLGDDHGALWVLKFYRPARWSDAQIDEEHAFTHELAAAELPVMLAYGEALAGTGKPLVAAGSIGSAGDLGRPATEEDPALPSGDEHKGTLRARNVVERAVILTPGSVLNVAVGELTSRPTSSPAPGTGAQKDMQSVLDETERRHIIQALEAANWVIAGPNGAAARLGMKRSTLHARMQKLGVQVTRSGPSQ